LTLHATANEPHIAALVVIALVVMVMSICATYAFTRRHSVQPVRL
jgi:hypothetical protein